jgi:hypothetical protein
VQRKLTILVAAIALVVPAVTVGCGGGDGDDGSGGKGTLSSTDNLKVDQDRADIQEFCALAPIGKGDLYDRALFSVVAAVDQLIIIYKKEPDAVYHEPLKKRDIKLQQVVEEAAKKLNSGCSRDGKAQAAKLTEALQSQ